MRGRRMRWFGNNLRSLFGWRDAAADVLEEMKLHVELRAAELIASGLPAADAWRQAEREVGDVRRVAPEVADLALSGDRRSWLPQRVEELGQDVRHSARVLRRTPASSAVALLTIAVALGANAAIFALVNTLFFRPLPIDPQGNLVRVREYREAKDGTRNQVDASRRTADAVAARTDLFESSVAIVGVSRALIREGGPLHVQCSRVGPGFTTVAGASPMLGRPFTVEEERLEAPVALISHRLWMTALGGVSSIVGERIRLNDRTVEIVGVLPRAFHIPYGSDVWFPSRFGESERSVLILARLAPGVTVAQARAGLEPDARRLNEAYPDVLRGMGITVITGRETFVGNNDRVALALMGAVAFLLLIGSTNVALLLTARFAARRREVAVRAALGCGRGRQVRQFVTEALLLFVVGGAFGLLLAAWAKDSLVVFLPEALATQVGLESIPLDMAVVLFAGGLSALTGVAFGLVAALRATRTDLQSVMKDAGRSLAGDRSGGTLRILASAEVALAIVLLTSAGIMTDTFRRQQDRNLGFDTRGVLTVQAGTDAPRYADGALRAAYVDDLLERLRGMPGVEAAAVTTVNPLCCGDWGARAAVEGQHVTSPQQLPAVQHQLVSDAYFETMRIPILKGRAFTPADRAGREMVVVVDDRAARRFWPGEDPIGKRLKRGMPDSPQPWMTVVGVAGTIEDRGEYTEAWYLPLAQHGAGPSSSSLHVMVRGADPIALAPAVKAISAELDPSLALHHIRTMDDVRAEGLQQNRMGALVTLVFAAAGLLLAALGLYGVLSFVLAADTREIGVRMALGATRGRIVRLMFERGLRITAWGTAAGVGLAVVAAIGIERIVPDSRADGGIIAASALMLATVALLAIGAPAIRALRLDPLAALRDD